MQSEFLWTRCLSQNPGDNPLDPNTHKHKTKQQLTNQSHRETRCGRQLRSAPPCLLYVCVYVGLCVGLGTIDCINHVTSDVGVWFLIDRFAGWSRNISRHNVVWFDASLQTRCVCLGEHVLIILVFFRSIFFLHDIKYGALSEIFMLYVMFSLLHYIPSNKAFHPVNTQTHPCTYIYPYISDDDNHILLSPTPCLRSQLSYVYILYSTDALASCQSFHETLRDTDTV